MRLFYYCPNVKKATGGVKVIYKHAQALKEMGFDCWVLHNRSGFQCNWFEHNAPIWNNTHISTHDHLIVPEVDVTDIADILLSKAGSYSIFVQNGYGVPRGNDTRSVQLVHAIYRKAKFILSISEDTSEMISTYFPWAKDKIRRVKPYVQADLFSCNAQEKQNIITYMPRKNADHAEKVIFALQSALPENWTIQPIDRVNEKTVAAYLKKSRIFLSFSSFEGLSLPPIEAALSGNHVIGYHGNGGKEYWNYPLYEEIYPFNIKAFINAVINRAAQMETLQNNSAESELAPCIEKLRINYSLSVQNQGIKSVAEEIIENAKESTTAEVKYRIQHPPVVEWLRRKKQKISSHYLKKTATS
jgi:hypothetical protein